MKNYLKMLPITNNGHKDSTNKSKNGTTNIDFTLNMRSHLLESNLSKKNLKNNLKPPLIKLLKTKIRNSRIRRKTRTLTFHIVGNITFIRLLKTFIRIITIKMTKKVLLCETFH